MPLRILLFVAALAIIVFGLYLLVKTRGSKTTLKIASVGELSTSSLGLVTLVIGAVLASFSIQVDEKHEAAQAHPTNERQAAGAVPPASSVNVNQFSTGDGSPNIGGVNSGSVTIQVEKSRNDR